MQRLRTAIKKMAAIGAGVAMTGATIMGALAAADLNQYPAPFVDKGKFNPNTAIVVGENAAASDTLGSVDIARQLQFDSKVCVPGRAGGSGVSVSGDSFEIGDGSDLLELNENIGDVQESITDLELDGLKGGIITTNEGTTEFNQYLRFRQRNSAGTNTLPSAPVVNFTVNDAPTDEVGDWMFIPEGSAANTSFFEYEVEFEDGLESEVVSKKLDDFEDEELVMLGTTYTIVDTNINTASASPSVTLEMLGGSVFDILEEGEEKTYNVNGKEYKVEVMIIEDSTPATVTFNINGEVTSQMTDGETEILKDGTLIGISDIILNEAGEAGSGDIVELYIGATKVQFKDDNWTNSENDDITNLGYEQGVEIDEESIEDAYVQIRGNALNTVTDKFEITSIRYRLTADALPGYKDLYVAPGHGVREFLDEPQGMLGTTWDIRYEGLDDTGVSMVKLDPRGDDEYTLEFENTAGTVYQIPYVTNEGGTFKFGDNDKDLVFIEGNYTEGRNLHTTGSNPVNSAEHNYTEFNVGILDYFVLSDTNKNLRATTGDAIASPRQGGFEDQIFGGLDDTSKTHIVRYNSIDTSDSTLSFDEEGSGTKEFTYETIHDATSGAILGKARLIFGGNTYIAYVANVTAAGNDNPLAIDMDGDGDVDRTEIRVTVNGGGIVDLGEATQSDGGHYTFTAGSGAQTWSNTGDLINNTDSELTPSIGGVIFNMTTLSEEFDENAAPSSGATSSTNDELFFTLNTRTDNSLGINTTTFNKGVNEPDDDDNNLYGMTDYGIKIHILDPEGSDNSETLTLEYPLVQRGAHVFVTMGDTKTTKGKAGEVCTVADIQLNNLLDSEVSDATDYNLILVGGPCANDLVSKIAGFPTCQGWTAKAGEAIIQLAENGENVAMLIAGTDAADTRAAAKIVSNYDEHVDELTGMKVMVSGTEITSETATA